MEGELATILKENYTGKPALLIGNGLNRMSQNSLSWDEMLDLLIKTAGTKSNRGNKPLTFLFEEILHSMQQGAKKENIRDLKSIVRDAIEKKIIPNDLHKKFAELNIENILTTNYDYCFEKSLDEDFRKQPVKTNNKSQFVSSKYSLGRYNRVKNKNIWHIHGELDNGYVTTPEKPYKYPEHSIMLGFDQYASYLNKIFETINLAEKYIENEEGYNEKALEKIIREQEIWISFFFTHDIHIIGLDLGVFEMHLWWLLNLRANLKDRRKCIENKITYYVPTYELLIKKDQIDLLKSLNVDIKAIHCEFNEGNYFREYYNNVLMLLKKI